MTPERADTGDALVALFERFATAIAGLDRLDDMRAADIASLKEDVTALSDRIEAVYRALNDHRIYEHRLESLA